MLNTIVNPPYAHALLDALREEGGDAAGQAERFAEIAPFLVEAGAGPFIEYASARRWIPEDGGQARMMRRCTVAERAAGGRTLVFFHNNVKLTPQAIRRFREAAAAAGFVGALVITTAQAAGPGIVSLQGWGVFAIGHGVLAECVDAVRSGRPPGGQLPMFPLAA